MKDDLSFLAGRPSGRNAMVCGGRAVRSVAASMGGGWRLRRPRLRALTAVCQCGENEEVIRFFLSLGSNVGDRAAAIAEALSRLRAAGLAIDRVSSLSETQPVGEAAGPGWFLNAAVSGETALGPEPILEICLSVERAMGRERTVAGVGRTPAETSFG